MIALVERGDEVLLAPESSFPVPMYSCLAGFVEPGETLEEAVRREIAEEVGVDVDRHPLPGQSALAVPALADARLPRPLDGGTSRSTPPRSPTPPGFASMHSP